MSKELEKMQAETLPRGPQKQQGLQGDQVGNFWQS